VTNVLGVAIEHRRPRGGAVIQSDQRTQFTLYAFTRRAIDSGFAAVDGVGW
jgi:transposase InsO family protein